MSRMFLKTRVAEISHNFACSADFAHFANPSTKSSTKFAVCLAVTVLGTMSLSQNEIRNLSHIASLKNYACDKPDLTTVGQDIYDLLKVPPKKRQAWKRRVVSVEIKPDHMYSPQEVAAVLSVSYDTATRIMSRMRRVANLAKSRAKKRLLQIKGCDLRAYIQDKLEG
jgi:hypothetical protein